MKRFGYMLLCVLPLALLCTLCGCSSGIEEMGNRSSVAGTVFSKVRGFSMIS